MRPTFIVHVEGSTPYAIDHWTRPYVYQHVAAGQATRMVKHPGGTHKGDWVARIYHLGLQETRPGARDAVGLRLVQTVKP